MTTASWDPVAQQGAPFPFPSMAHLARTRGAQGPVAKGLATATGGANMLPHYNPSLCTLPCVTGLAYRYGTRICTTCIRMQALKAIFGYSDTQIASVGSAFNIGGYLAIPSGYLYDRMEKHKRAGPRCGPWSCCWGVCWCSSCRAADAARTAVGCGCRAMLMVHGATPGAEGQTGARAELLAQHSLRNMLPGLCSNAGDTLPVPSSCSTCDGRRACMCVSAPAGSWRWWAPSSWRAATWGCTAVRQGSWSPVSCWCASSHC